MTQYHLNRDELDQANHYAQKCLQYDDTKEEAKAFLRTIAQKRIKVEENPMMVSANILAIFDRLIVFDNLNLIILPNLNSCSRVSSGWHDFPTFS